MADTLMSQAGSPALRHSEIGRWLAGAEAAIQARDWPVAAEMLRSVLLFEPFHAEASARLQLVREQASHRRLAAQGTHEALHVRRGAALGLSFAVLVAAASAIALGMWAGS